jgi:hypothetical protein
LAAELRGLSPPDSHNFSERTNIQRSTLNIQLPTKGQRVADRRQ